MPCSAISILLGITLGFNQRQRPFLNDVFNQYFLTTQEEDFDKGLHEVVLQDWREADNSPISASIVFDKEIKATKAFAFTRTKSIFGSTGL